MKTWTREEIKILTEQYGDVYDISLLPIDRSPGSIKHKASRLGLNKTFHRPRYTHDVNDRFFSEVNNTSAYWAGVLAADGYIAEKSLELCMCDRCVVSKFKEEIGYTGKLGIRPPNAKANRVKTAYRVHISRPKIIQDLKNIWNIHSNKSFTLQPPNIHKCKLAYIIGFIDGDGWILKTNDNLIEFGCCGTKEILTWIKNELQMPNPMRKNNSDGNHYAIRVSGKKAEAIIHKLLNVKLNFRLPRKWDIIHGSN